MLPIPSARNIESRFHEQLINVHGISAVFVQGEEIANRFVVQRLLGSGASGAVLLCTDSLISNFPVALKVFPPHVLSDPRMKKQVARELLLGRRVSSDHVAKIYDLLSTEQITALILEFVRGETLHQVIKHRSSLSSAETLSIVHDVASGLGALHQQGVIHRDIKPSNLIRTKSGQVKIVDLGIAGIQENSASSAYKISDVNAKNILQINPDEALCTPLYAAPEYLVHGTLDHRADIYALGLVWLELLLNEPVFQEENLFKLVEAKVKGVSSEKLKKVDAHFRDLLFAMIDPKPEGRPSDAREIQRAAKELVEGTRVLRDSHQVFVSSKLGFRKAGLFAKMSAALGIFGAGYSANSRLGSFVRQAGNGTLQTAEAFAVKAISGAKIIAVAGVATAGGVVGVANLPPLSPKEQGNEVIVEGGFAPKEFIERRQEEAGRVKRKLSKKEEELLKKREELQEITKGLRKESWKGYRVISPKGK